MVGVRAGGEMATALDFAAQLAVGLATRLVVATVFVAPSSAVAEVVGVNVRHQVDTAVEAFPDVCAELAFSTVSWCITSAVGDPAVQLARLARTLDAASLVIGSATTGRPRWARRFGRHSVAERLIRLTEVPVVVVPTRCALDSRITSRPVDAPEGGTGTYVIGGNLWMHSTPTARVAPALHGRKERDWRWSGMAASMRHSCVSS